MENYNIGDWIFITHGGFGTYIENVGCVCQVVEVGMGSVKVRQTRLNKRDGSSYEVISSGFRLATPEEIPIEINQEPNYEIY